MCSGGGGGGATSTQTVTKSDPWEGQQPYLQDVFANARNQYKTRNYFPGSTVTPFATETEQALAMQADRARSGSPLMAAGNRLLTDTMEGDYLNSNPYIDTAVNRALGKVRGSLDSQFAKGGRYGSGLHQTALAGAYGDTAASMYGQNYESERDRQTQGMLFAPQMANQDYVDAQQLASVGSAREGMAQANLNDQLNRWNFDQNKQDDALARYSQLIQGNYGQSGSSTSTSPTNTNSAASGLGGALSGAMLGGSLYASGLIPSALMSSGMATGLGALGGLALLS
jgi:hypothetical protein